MKKLITLACVAAIFFISSVANAGSVPSGGKCAGWFVFTEGESEYTGIINGSSSNPEGITHFNCTFENTPPNGIKLTGSERWISVPNKDGAKVSGMSGYVAVSDKTINKAACSSDVQGAAITTPDGLRVIQAQAKKRGCSGK